MAGVADGTPPRLLPFETPADAPSPVIEETDPDWARTLQVAILGICVIKTSNVRGFDGTKPGAGEATGFVVNKEKGLVLTNRHVTTVGPIRATITFHNKEEVDCVPVYRDPVHDFGFLKYDPTSVKFADVCEIPLSPHKARIGTEIRVVGNDAGERLSILHGSLARLDKNAPWYGHAQYSDFNTWYYGAASSTSPGSSGSPVINIDGDAIALNAGGKSGTASSYYLPLDRVVRALRRLTAQQPIPRGCLGTRFRFRAFNECRRLGLSPDTEQRVRRVGPAETGMLVVKQVLKQGVADGVLQVGDVLVEVNGAIMTSFTVLEGILDGVMEDGGGSVEVAVERGDKGIVRCTVPVMDLQAGDCVPTKYLEFGGGVLQGLSYILAMFEGLAMGTVALAQTGYTFDSAAMNRGSIVAAVNGVPTPTLDACIDVLAKLPNLAHCTITLRHVLDHRYQFTDIITTDRRFFPMRVFARNVLDDIKLTDVHAEVWRMQELPPPPFPPSRVGEELTTGGLKAKSVAGQAAARALVIVQFRAPFAIEGFAHGQASGVGIVIDKASGLVLCDRATLPIMMGDVEIIVGGSVCLPARILFLHPFHNFGVLKFNPSELGPGVLDPLLAEVQFSSKPIQAGDALSLVGLTATHEVVEAAVSVKNLDYYELLQNESAACYTPYNGERAELHGVPANCRGGVLLDRWCRVRCVWALFQDGKSLLQAGVPCAGGVADTVNQLRRHLTAGAPLTARWLEAEVLLRSQAEACMGFGLSAAWARRLEAVESGKRDVLYVHHCISGSHAEQALRPGDLILAVNGTPVTSLARLQTATMWKRRVSLTVLRDGVEEDVEVRTRLLDGSDLVQDVVVWAGLCLHKTHGPVQLLGFQPKFPSCDVFCSQTVVGSPGATVDASNSWLLAINDTPTTDLDSVLAIVTRLPPKQYCRCLLQDVNTGVETLVTFKPDTVFFPTTRYRVDATFSITRTHMDAPYTRTAPPSRSTSLLQHAAVSGQGTSVGTSVGSASAPTDAGAVAAVDDHDHDDHDDDGADAGPPREPFSIPPLFKTKTAKRWALGTAGVVAAVVATGVVTRHRWRGWLTNVGWRAPPPSSA